MFGTELRASAISCDWCAVRSAICLPSLSRLLCGWMSRQICRDLRRYRPSPVNISLSSSPHSAAFYQAIAGNVLAMRKVQVWD